jgi:hypothetical protein
MAKNETNPEDGASGFGKTCSLLGSENTPDHAPKADVEQAETAAQLPTFFELIAASSKGFLHGIIGYSKSALGMIDADDPDGYIDSVLKMISQANELASIARPLKKPTIISHETADRYEREAAALRDRAYLLETEASHHRAAASIGGSAQ